MCTQTCEILDAGCGTGGAMSGFFADYGNAVGSDYSPLALEFFQARDLSPLAVACQLV